MDGLAVVSIVFGVLVIVFRGPLIFAPGRTIDFYRRLIATDTRVRIIGVPIAVIGLSMIGLAWDSTETAPRVLFGFGWFLAVGAAVLLGLSSRWRRMAESFMVLMRDGMDPMVLRFIGVVAVAIGALFVYLGLEVL
jgi:uncharacterized protein YjeT (DUF2065 family)